MKKDYVVVPSIESKQVYNKPNLCQSNSNMAGPTYHSFASRCFIFLLVFPASSVIALAHNSQNNNSNKETSINRREVFSRGISSAILLLPAFVEPANAACMPGDLSAECIGVYKIPIRDATESPTLNTPEALKRNAPDLNYVKPMEAPTSVIKAKEELLAQRAAADDIKTVVLAGRLEEAGIKVLNLIPKVTMASYAIQEQVQTKYPVSSSGANQMRVVQFQQSLQECIALWSSIDIEIGQGLRGQMGASAVAQLAILKSITEATAAFDDFLQLVDANTR